MSLLKSLWHGSLCIFLANSAACAAVAAATALIVLNQDTVKLEGWLSAKGEWTLFAAPDFENYYPYLEIEDEKCVSMINATGRPRAEFEVLHAKRVMVEGSAVRYLDLPIGDDPIDVLRMRRYFNDVPVFNFCLRELLFAVTEVRERR